MLKIDRGTYTMRRLALLMAMALAAMPAAAQNADPLCNYAKALDTTQQPHDRYATLPDTAFGATCFTLPKRGAIPFRIPKLAFDFANRCVTALTDVTVTPANGDCTHKPVFSAGDEFSIRDWNGQLMLSIKRVGYPQVTDIPLTPGQLKGASGVPWLQGSAGTMLYYVYLEHRAPVNGRIPKFYRLEVFDTQDVKWGTTCDKARPTTAAVLQTVPGCPPVVGGGAQTNSSGGGEPPPGPR